MTALAIATTTSVAIAQPLDYDYKRRDRDRSWFTRHIPWKYDRDRDGIDDRTGGRTVERFDRSRWVPLAQGYSARTERQFISVQGRGGRFSKIRVESVRGAPVINKVVIEYLGDPNAQAVELNTRLPRGSGETIRLNGDRRINRIVVYSEPSYRGAYSVFGA